MKNFKKLFLFVTTISLFKAAELSGMTGEMDATTKVTKRNYEQLMGKLKMQLTSDPKITKQAILTPPAQKSDNPDLVLQPIKKQETTHESVHENPTQAPTKKRAYRRYDKLNAKLNQLQQLSIQDLQQQTSPETSNTQPSIQQANLIQDDPDEQAAIDGLAMLLQQIESDIQEPEDMTMQMQIIQQNYEQQPEGQEPLQKRRKLS